MLDEMGNKREALRELAECLRQRPSLDQQFMIYRFQRLISDSLQEGSRESGGYEYISFMNFESHFRKFK